MPGWTLADGLHHLVISWLASLLMQTAGNKAHPAGQQELPEGKGGACDAVRTRVKRRARNCSVLRHARTSAWVPSHNAWRACIHTGAC